MNAAPPAWLLDGRPGRARGLLITAAVGIVLLVYEGTQPGAVADVAPPLPHFDKLMHFVAHFLIALPAYWGLVLLGRPRDVRRRVWLFAAAVVLLDMLAGLGVELAQASLGAAHGRAFDWFDVAANGAGAVAAVGGSLMIVLRFVPPKRQGDGLKARPPKHP